MLSKSTEKLEQICHKHKCNVILFSLEETETLTDSLLCVQCLDERPQIKALNWNEVKSKIQTQKQIRQEEFDAKVKPLLEIIQSSQEINNQIKQKVIENVDQIDTLLKNWLLEIEIKKQSKTSMSFQQELEIFKKQQTRIEINKNSDQIFEDVIQCCKQNVDSFDNQYKQLLDINEIQLLQECMDSVQQIIGKNPFSTSQQLQNGADQIKCECPLHKQPIIRINIDKDIENGKRTLCQDCQQDNALTLQQFGERWKSYQEKTRMHLELKRGEFENEINQKKQYSKKFLEFCRNNQNILFNLMEKKISEIREIQVSYLEKPMFFSSISLFRLQELAEELSLREKQKSKNCEEFEDVSLQATKHVLMKMKEINSTISKQLKDFNSVNENSIIKSGYQNLSYSQVFEVSQREFCGAIAFNFEGTIMAAGSDNQIKLWRLEGNELESLEVTLTGHEKEICCLVFSGIKNFLVSGSFDNRIRCWSENQDIWSCVNTLKSHNDHIQCLILNKKDDQLLSCSLDKSIKIWNGEQLNYDYSLTKHTGCVYCIALNQDESKLVSCGKDKQIIVWDQSKNKKWQFKQVIQNNTNDFGMRVSFIDSNTIAWQQYRAGVTHIFILEKGVFIEKPQLQIKLNEEQEDNNFFPSIFNENRNLLIQKHHQYVYLLRKQDSELNIIEPIINCDSEYNFGGLTANGQYLVIWNDETCLLRLYQIKYE